MENEGGKGQISGKIRHTGFWKPEFHEIAPKTRTENHLLDIVCDAADVDAVVLRRLFEPRAVFISALLRVGRRKR